MVNMGDHICFNLTRLGESHVKSGKPCQDYSLSWQSEDGVSVAIVCDGHGGSTYVRSDVGSRLAAEIALKNIQTFIATPDFARLKGRKGAVTAIPKNVNDALFPNQNQRRQNLNENQKEQLEQDLRYYSAVKQLPVEEKMFRQLFGAIYVQWIDAITTYTADNPFNDEELRALDGKKLVKAYGSTLMAFVVTPQCWFSFHIGDGKIEACNANMEWSEPVPWDCNCFLNMTTSLCNTDPVPMFRYAFSGLGDFPTAVFLGSDGIDDTWGSTENLQNFYAETLAIIADIGPEKAIEELGNYLPEMSRRGSRDDMSIAAIIDPVSLQGAIEVFQLRRKLRTLFLERNQREKELVELKNTIQAKEKEIESLLKEIEKESSLLKEFIASFKKQQTEKELQLSAKRDDLNVKHCTLDSINKDFSDKTAAFNDWKEANRGEVESLKSRIAEIKEKNERSLKEDLEVAVLPIDEKDTDGITLNACDESKIQLEDSEVPDTADATEEEDTTFVIGEFEDVRKSEEEDNNS